MKTFKELVFSENIDLYEFNEAIHILENNSIIYEGILDKLSSGIKSKIEFIKELAELTSNKLSDLLILFKDSRFFEIFKAISFSISKLVQLIKTGIETYNNIQDIIAKKIIELGGVQYIRKNLHLLDEFFNTHPVLKKIGGVAVAGLLLYIWLNMSFTPDLEYSMDFRDIIMALNGTYSLADLFASHSGITMLIYFATGAVLGISFPWVGGKVTHIVGGLLYSTWRLVKDKKIIINIPEDIKIGKYPKVKIK